MTSTRKELTVEKIRPGGKIITMHKTVLKITEITEETSEKIIVMVKIEKEKLPSLRLTFKKTLLERIKLTGCRQYIPAPEEE